MIMPRLEKGYKNEKQYSKLDYYFSGDKKPEMIGRGRDGDKRVNTKMKWFAFQQQFFSAIMTAGDEFASADLNVKFYSEDEYKAEGNLMACSSKLRSDFTAGSDNIVIPYTFYFGPNDYRTLKSYDLKYEKIIPLGGWLVGWFSRLVIIPCFDFLGRFISNYGLVILLMTLFIKLIISPLTIKSYKSSAKMQVIKPEVDKLNAKYPSEKDAMKKQQAMMELYNKAGISPMGGCLPMLLQMPILFAMFRFFPASIELRQQKFLWADDLSSYDSIWDFGVNIPLLGDHLSLFALLMALTMFFYSKMTSGQMSDDPNMAGMKFMSVWLMPIMMFFICNNLSAALSYYYLLSNIITMIMTWYIRKFVVTEDKVRAEMMLKANQPKKKSKWQQRLEEAQKMQEQMQKQQKRR
jgi:YidC/Oxa1 family membrane protein insertase